jgi:hypothetical protein
MEKPHQPPSDHSSPKPDLSGDGSNTIHPDILRALEALPAEEELALRKCLAQCREQSYGAAYFGSINELALCRLLSSSPQLE